MLPIRLIVQTVMIVGLKSGRMICLRHLSEGVLAGKVRAADSWRNPEPVRSLLCWNTQKKKALLFRFSYGKEGLFNCHLVLKSFRLCLSVEQHAEYALRIVAVADTGFARHQPRHKRRIHEGTEPHTLGHLIEFAVDQNTDRDIEKHGVGKGEFAEALAGPCQAGQVAAHDHQLGADGVEQDIHDQLFAF